MKTSEARWYEGFADILVKIGFSPSLADDDLRIRDCGTHHEYMTVYVDDLIIVSKDPMKITEELKTIGGYNLKGVGIPDIIWVVISFGRSRMVTVSQYCQPRHIKRIVVIR